MNIKFNKVSYIYQPNTPFEHQAIKDITLDIPSGQFVAIIGHTGSGKSTLIQHLNGLIRPTFGEVQIGDFKLTKKDKAKDMKTLRSKVGVVFQYPEHQLFEENVKKDIAFGPTNFGLDIETIAKRTRQAIEKVGLDQAILERSPFELSGGQMRRVAIAGILVTEPEIYVLDEPTAGLDPRGQQEIMDMFYQIHQAEKATMVLVTHNMSDALKYADHIIILNQGEKYLEGTPEEIFTQTEAIQKVQLDVPESIAFLKAFNKKYDKNIALGRLSPEEIAKKIKTEMSQSHE